jgi:type IV secretory pathway TrbD component
MKTPINRHVARPERWLYCARTLLALEFLAGIIIGIAFRTPLATLFLWIVTHPLCIVLSIREPHIEAVLRVLLRQRPTPNHWNSDDRTYVP